jgi:hypothetical protein
LWGEPRFLRRGGTADSPCFHSHSFGSLRSGAIWGLILIGRCHLAIELKTSLPKLSFHRDLAVTRTRRLGCLNFKPSPSGRFRHGLTLPQWLIHFDRQRRGRGARSSRRSASVNGDPIANISLLEDPATNFLVIMKDGVIYKNTVSATQTGSANVAGQDGRTRSKRGFQARRGIPADYA